MAYVQNWNLLNDQTEQTGQAQGNVTTPTIGTSTASTDTSQPTASPFGQLQGFLDNQQGQLAGGPADRPIFNTPTPTPTPTPTRPPQGQLAGGPADRPIFNTPEPAPAAPVSQPQPAPAAVYPQPAPFIPQPAALPAKPVNVTAPAPVVKAAPVVNKQQVFNANQQKLANQINQLNQIKQKTSQEATAMNQAWLRMGNKAPSIAQRSAYNQSSLNKLKQFDNDIRNLTTQYTKMSKIGPQ